MQYNHKEIEENWQKFWADNQTFKATNPAQSSDQGDADKPKYYVLDMFPYPSGAGLHVGHPLGYIASDIYARYNVIKGLMYCIRKAMILLVCQQNNMPFKQGNILQKLPKQTLQHTEDN